MRRQNDSQFKGMGETVGPKSLLTFRQCQGPWKAASEKAFLPIGCSGVSW